MRGWRISAGERRSLVRQAAVLAVLMGLPAGFAGCHPQAESSATLLEEARTALQNGDYQHAEELAARVPEASREWLKAGEIAGEAAVKQERYAEAIRYYLALGKRQRSIGLEPFGDFFAAETYRSSGRLTEAEQYYRQFLSASPANAATHERLAFLLSTTGRRWEALPHYVFLVRSGTASTMELVLLADPDRPIEQREFLETCQRQAPNDRLVQFGLAAHAFWEGKSEETRARLEALLPESPKRLAAQAMLGELLVHQSDHLFQEWHRKLPAAAENHPDIWYVRGQWARKHDQPQVAARCFWESLRLAPIHRRAMFQFGQVLRTLNDPAGAPVENRARQLIELTQILDEVLRSKSRQSEPYQKAALLLERMGRIWEACAWGVVARQQFPDAEWPSQLFERRAGLLTDQLPLVLDDENLALKYDRSSWPGIDSLTWDRPLAATSPVESPAAVIQFVEVDDGPDFTYLNGCDPATPGARQFEQTGGGVAVLDFDRDGWPDLFFSQGGDWQTGATQPTVTEETSDRLFRNIGGRPIDVSGPARLNDDAFGQGCSAGDFDNDGFPDLYVANFGRNQLYRNNGDGTFTDVTEAAGLKSEDWTSSCVIVDLNADGFPDLFDVNYLEGAGILERICNGKACSPSVFAGAPDRLYLSRGDGVFDLIDPAVPDVDGKGLGVIAADFHGLGKLDLFIANDQVPNFLLRNNAPPGSREFGLEEVGFVSGVAFNQDGLAMASMGIAADDADGDGRLDLYVTTFDNESSMLFLQQADALFVDAATTAGLRAATWPYVGWGAQFLDADLDGHPDLVSVNGHVDDYRDENGAYHMRPQFFRNLGRARFEEPPADQTGEFFTRKRLGRGLARLDWNRDGLMDFVVSNMGDRASLVLNATRNPGHSLSVRLTARDTARDAIGSVIEVRAGQRSWRKHLVAGDGYMASNERQVQVGLGDVATVDEIVVRWPDGTTSAVRNLPADRVVDMIQGKSHAIVWRGLQESSLVEVVTSAESVRRQLDQ